jgi:hypothetical protein
MRTSVPAQSRLSITLTFECLAGILCCFGIPGAPTWANALSVEGIHVVPHQQSPEMRYRQKTDFSLGARVELFLRNASEDTLVLPASLDIRLRGQTPSELLRSDDWAWHDFPSVWGDETVRLPPGAITVWSWNGKRANWGANTNADLAIGLPGSATPQRFEVAIANPSVWLSAVTFLGSEADPFPDSLIFHVANETAEPIRLEACRLWLPTDNQSWRVLLPQPWVTNLSRFPTDGIVPPRDCGGARVETGRLPLTYTALEVRLSDSRGRPFTLWAHLRIKREWFDISGGWVSSKVGEINTLQSEAFLKTLRRMHINTAHIADVTGYTDQTGPDGLYTRYPLKYFNKLQPFSHYDIDAMLPRIHAVEFLGEPQYGGGRPVPPQEVWKALAPYAATRLPTSVTHSEERLWRLYAGLSDYPHYDAYRVTAPSPDAWSQYDRWDGQRIRWGAPLETIGDMTRSLRELNRPRPIAYWSQGPHHDWSGYGGRKRASPTPDELRLQAYHALASRITSLYWFNLSLKSLVKFPDLIEPITRVGREIRMLDQFYLEGAACQYRRVLKDGKPDWDLASITTPEVALLFAMDLAYEPDATEKVFRFGPPRISQFDFNLPSYLRESKDVFHIDADGIQDVTHRSTPQGVAIDDCISKVGIYVATADPSLRKRLEARRREFIRFEESFGFDPARSDADSEALRSLAIKP